jgi:hypothetical protein
VLADMVRLGPVFDIRLKQTLKQKYGGGKENSLYKGYVSLISSHGGTTKSKFQWELVIGLDVVGLWTEEVFQIYFYWSFICNFYRTKEHSSPTFLRPTMMRRRSPRRMELHQSQ